MSPSKSDDLSGIVDERNGKFIALRSRVVAEYIPNYEEIGEFSTLKEAESFLQNFEH